MNFGLCMLCDQPAIGVYETDDSDGLAMCLRCAVDDKLHLSEAERTTVRDFLAETVKDIDGLPQYDFADHVIGRLHKMGFAVVRRSVAE